MASKMVTNLVVFVIVLLTTESFGINDEYLAPVDTSASREKFLYNETEITLCNMKKSWEEALHICKSMQATLVNLDSLEKATFFGELLAETELVLEDVWVGAQRNSNNQQFGYLWTSGKPLRRSPTDIWTPPADIQDPPNPGYPQWIERDKEKPSETDSLGNCVAIERSFHDHPVFLDFDCNLERAFACEKNAPSHMTNESVSHENTVECNDREYSIYNGAVTFDEAVGFCAFNSMSLASFDDIQCTNIVAMQMMKARPILENAWIGGRGAEGVWTWLHSGQEIVDNFPLNITTTRPPAPILPTKPARPSKPTRPSRPTRYPLPFVKKYEMYQPFAPKFPPFRDYLPRKKNGCLLLDRHVCDHTIFLEARCERKKGFVCMKEKSVGRSGRAIDQRLASDENYFYVISKEKLSWDEANEECKARNTKLAHVTSPDVVTQLIRIMAESNFDPIDHLWVSGQVMSSKNGEYYWMDPNANMKITGPIANGTVDAAIDGFWHLPWCDTEISPKYGCLNMDRENHKSGTLYGLDCKKKQHFICLMDKRYQGPADLAGLETAGSQNATGNNNQENVSTGSSPNVNDKIPSLDSIEEPNDIYEYYDDSDYKVLRAHKKNSTSTKFPIKFKNKDKGNNTVLINLEDAEKEVKPTNATEQPEKHELNDVTKNPDENISTIKTKESEKTQNGDNKNGVDKNSNNGQEEKERSFTSTINTEESEKPQHVDDKKGGLKHPQNGQEEKERSLGLSDDTKSIKSLIMNISKSYKK